jgi:hypothetical protein
MRRFFLSFSFLVVFLSPAFGQELDCTVTVRGLEQLIGQGRDNLANFKDQVQTYLNTTRWTNENLGDYKIKCAMDIAFTASQSGTHYQAQVFIGSTRPINQQDKSTAIVRIKDNNWEFDYSHTQTFTHDEFRFDPLLSFLDYYAYVMLGYDFNSYKSDDGQEYFQKAMDVFNRAQGAANAGAGWDMTVSSGFGRGQFITEIMDPKFSDFRDAYFEYYFYGLDYLAQKPVDGKKAMLRALKKIHETQDAVNQQSICINLFFETKYLEIADTFRAYPETDIYSKLATYDPQHIQTYTDYSKK